MAVYCPIKVFHRIKLDGRDPFIRLQCREGRTKMVLVEGLAIDPQNEKPTGSADPCNSARATGPT